MILEYLFIKGLIGLKAFLAMGGSKAVLMGLAKIASTAGWVAAAKAAGITVVAIGGIIWTTERIKIAADAVDSLRNNKFGPAALGFAQLALSCHIAPEMLPDALERILPKLMDSSDAATVVSAVRELEKPIRDAYSTLK